MRCAQPSPQLPWIWELFRIRCLIQRRECPCWATGPTRPGFLIQPYLVNEYDRLVWAASYCQFIIVDQVATNKSQPKLDFLGLDLDETVSSPDPGGLGVSHSSSELITRELCGSVNGDHRCLAVLSESDPL